MSGGFLAVQAKRTKDRNKKINLGCDSIQQGWTNQCLVFIRMFRGTVGQHPLLSHDNQPQEDAFKEADVNNDGTLTIEEWTDVLTKTGHDNPRLVMKRKKMVRN